MIPALFSFGILNLLISSTGYIFMKKKMLLAGWFTGISSVVMIHFVFFGESPIMRMWALISTAFTGMKVIAATTQFNRQQVLTFGQWLAFVFTWAGMRAEVFEQRSERALPGAGKMILFGASRVFAGLLLVLIARQLVHTDFIAEGKYLLIIASLLIAFSLILHFGLLNISAGAWRYLGVDAYPLFKKPLHARTLNEFWSRRWNIAFSEMTSVAVFRPLKERAGGKTAMLVAFLFSGLLHELAISLPVHNGYGLPMLYFFIQGLAVIAERMLIEKKPLLFQHTAFCKIWLLFWLVAPIPLLFHRAFVQEILFPMAGINW